MEIWYRHIRPAFFETEREFLKLRDGGTVAIDWVIDSFGGKPKKDDNRNYPVLLIVSGLAGDKANCYNIDVINEAVARGYKIAMMCHRGSCGVRLTSPKFYDCTAVEDLEDVAAYVHKTYIEGTRRNLHGYGVSLGASLYTLYLVKFQERSVFKSVITLGNLYDIGFSEDYFQRRSCFGWYS